MTANFEVPAPYFYALIANLPIDVGVDLRYRTVVASDWTRIVENLRKARDAGVIDTSLLITPEQAARRLVALGSANGNAPICNVGVGSSLLTGANGWLAYANPTPADDADTDILPFWNTVLAPSVSMALTNPILAGGHLELIVCALIKDGDPSKLLDAITTYGPLLPILWDQTNLANPLRGIPNLPSVFPQGLTAVASLQSVKDLDPSPWNGGPAISAAQWLAIFAASFYGGPTYAMPQFAEVGTKPLTATTPAAQAKQILNEQTSAFLLRLAQFFNTPALSAAATAPTAGGLPQLDLPLFDPMGDPISAFLVAYRAASGNPGYVFGQSLTLDDVNAGPQAASTVFPTDGRAAAWLLETADAINALYAVTQVGGVSDQLRFALAEALYARGLTSAAQIAALTLDDLASTLIGTPAYPYVAQIAAKAGGPAPAPPTPPPGQFGPINDGTLVNCVPPPWLSPLGPVEYLREMLLLPLSATCDLPQGDPKALSPTLGDVVTSRRGPIGQLLATRANLETGLPMMDLVNECLETVVADSSVDVINQTSGDSLAGHPLGPPGVKPDEDAEPYRHEPDVIFRALPEHSSPGAGLAGAYAKLRNDFTACVLPYSQPIDVCRSYLHELHTSRFAAMRRLRKDITEFVLDPDPAHLPVDFATHRWRYPVRVEIAREALGVTPEEYTQLFTTNIGPGLLAQLYGFAPSAPITWMTTVLQLSEFLKRTCLTYCEFIALWRSGYVPFHAKTPGKKGDDFPLCEPCYIDKYFIVFTDPVDQALTRLAVFIRLWRKLRHLECGAYTFTQLADVATVLELFSSGVNVNPDFVRQVAAFQMLREDFRLPLLDPRAPPPGSNTGAARTHLLALFVGPIAAEWPWAIGALVERVQQHARSEHAGRQRPSEFIKLLVANLDALSSLAGFDPTNPAKTWFVHPSNALRFAEVLSKICASHFGVGELLYLFTVADALDGDDPFPLPTTEDSLDSPLDLPDDSGELSLWSLRRKLLEIDVSDEDARSWTWPRIEGALRDDFGFASPAVFALGKHYFPRVLEQSGNAVQPQDRQYRFPLAAGATSPAMWSAPSDGPFHYDAVGADLWVEVPLRDEAVLAKLSRIRALSPAEQAAVQTLYFAPRLDLAPFAFLFPTFDQADRHLVQGADEEARWAYFQRCFALCHARCAAIARHLSDHVAAVTGDREHDSTDLAWRLLRQLAADENAAKTPPQWQLDDGVPPMLTWTLPTGGAFAALLGLLGTGLLGEFHIDGAKNPVWREMRGPMDAFDHTRDQWNAPVPTVLPAMDAALPPAQAGFAGVRNGILVTNVEGRPLGGAQGYCVRWNGVLLVDRAGPHEFFAGAHTPGEERPDAGRARGRRWRVVLRRGQRTWVVLAHEWGGESGPGDRSSPLPLKRGAYEVTVELERCAPGFDDPDDVHPLHTGLELKYAGPDTDGEVIALPLHRLFVSDKSTSLGAGLDERIQGAPKQLLDALYVSTLRDVRRTYQRAFKALLLARRFELSARTFADWGQSELGYLLDHPDRFEGISFYGSVGAWTTHHVYFDPDFLPIRDPHLPPVGDDRAQPSPQRQQALFDQWERLFDYVHLREWVRRATEQPVWLLFDEAAQSPTEDPKQLLRHLGINASYAPLSVAFDSAYSVATADLLDERWAVRCWRVHEWLRRLEHEFRFKDIRLAHPDLWASDDPGASGGNANLTTVVTDALIENGPPRRYQDLRELDDGLRERARCALLAYLCGPSGGAAASPKELSGTLLIDVESGLGERASRIEEAVTAVQNLVERARLGLESWHPSPGFLSLWDGGYASFHVWQACKRRQIYCENWVECEEHEKASRTEAFRFLESELRRATLTVPEPGGLSWWDGARAPAHPGLELLQAREPSTIVIIPNQPEALDLLGTPERSARRSWLASIPELAPPTPPPTPPGGTTPSNPGGPPAGTPGIDLRVASAPAAAAPAPLATSAPPRTAAGATGRFPYWIEAAIRLGVRFLRVAAGGVPPASDPFAPRHAKGRSRCCDRCGRRHDAIVDEYYFWLIDARYFSVDVTDSSGNDTAIQDANANWDDDPGSDNGDLPKLLSWTPQPSVYLMWARMHDGEIQQPRRSTEVVSIAPGGAAPSLQFDGRKQDSLYFTVVGAAPAPAGYAAQPNPGFRYDLEPDSALVVPLVTPDPPANVPVPGLPAYPYFGYFEPGAPLAPLSRFSESVAVACALRSHCRFEAALDWYALYYDPLRNDVRWCWQSVPPPPPPTPPSDTNNPVVDVARRPDGDTGTVFIPPEREDDGVCCRFSVTNPHVCRHRAIVLDYLETLLEWAHATMRRNAPEAFQRARVILDTAAKIIGPSPITVLDWDDLPDPPPTVLTLNPLLYGPPLNPRLLAIYDRVADGLSLIHHDLNARRLRNGRLREDMPYWTQTGPFERAWRGDNACCEGCGCRDCVCVDAGDWCCLPSPYRFISSVQKALELANEVRAFGGALLSAFEKGDAEYLAYVRMSHERQLTERALHIREDAWRAADWDVQSLKKAKLAAQNQLQYYTGLIAGGLNGGELDYQSLMNGTIGSYDAAIVSETVATILGVIPDVFVGTSDFTWLAIGTKLAQVFNGIAQISSTNAQIDSTNAQLRLTQSGWDRRLAEWQHQVDQFTIQIDQIERQIMAAERRRDSALHDLNNTRLQIQQSRELLDFLRDKFTSHALYLFLQKETAALHRQMFDLALRVSRSAERAFNFERGYTPRRFIDCEPWRDLREGLLSGEKLALSLRRMEQCYRDENVREYELTKHISLRQLFPQAFLRLKVTGECEIDIDEWRFDLDYPGQYMRRVKNVALTIPCVVGPYTGVHCRLTLLSSKTRIAPWLLEPIAPCCKEPPPPKQLPPPPCGCWSELPPLPPSGAHELGHRRGGHEPCDDHHRGHCDEHGRLHGGYLMQPEDPRIVRRYLAKEAIATSSGQNDTGMFELNFRDDRYLPFEFEGAVSRWRLELPADTNYFDMDTLSDVVLHLNYTAREGGDVLRRAAHESGESHLPDAGRRMMDVRQELPDEWRRFHALPLEERYRRLELPLSRDTFMFLPGARDVWVTRLEVLFEAPDAEPGHHHEIAFVPGHKHGCKRAHAHEEHDVREIQCVAGSAWPGWYHGTVDVHLGPLGRGDRDRLGALRFGRSCGRVNRVVVVFAYEARRRKSSRRVEREARR